MTLRLTVVALLIQVALGAVVPPALNPGPQPDAVDTNQGLRPPIVFAGSRFRPMQQQQRPWMMSTTPSSNVSIVDSGLENSVPAVVIMSSRTTAGMLETMIANTLLRQCKGNAEPVLNFYQCVENTTDLQNVWARMGLNATMLRIKTITLTMMRDSNITQSKNTIITMSDVDPEDQISSMNDLVQLVSSQAPNLCRSIDGLMNCFDPYLASCFADAEETNEVPSAAGSTTPSAPVAIDQSSDLDSNDDDEQTSDRDSRRYDEEEEGDMDFFKVPLLITHSEVSRFMRLVFQQLCANDATPLQLLVNSVPCLIQTANQDNCRRWDNQVGIVRDMMAQQNVTTASQELCGALRSAAECHLDLTIQSCGSDVANLGRDLYQLYFQSVECASPMGGPTATLRPPFNQAIL